MGPEKAPQPLDLVDATAGRGGKPVDGIVQVLFRGHNNGSNCFLEGVEDMS